jgi:hypothetical protein
MSIKVSVENYGTFFIDSSKVTELIAWLVSNYHNPALGEVNNHQSHGNQIING